MRKNSNKKSCNNCNLMRKGDCCGFGRVCKDFEAAYNISNDELKMWPGGRDRNNATGVHYKSKMTRLRGEHGAFREYYYTNFDYDSHGNRRISS